MRSQLARLAVLGICALTVASCGSGTGTSLPFAGPPNNAGGSSGQFQPGGNSTALLRFIQGSPDHGTVDVCVDNLPFGVTAPAIAYGQASAALYAVAGGITHTVAVYPTQGGANVGLECPTAPGPYFGTPAILVTTIGPGTSGTPVRETIVLGGTTASGTLGLYVYGEPSFPSAPANVEAISHNAAPAFSAATANKSVGFGYVPVAGPATTLPGANSVAAPTPSGATFSVVNAAVVSTIAAVPASFYDGAGVVSGAVVPVTTVPAPAATGASYTAQLYAIDAPGGGLGLVAVQEQTGFGF